MWSHIEGYPWVGSADWTTGQRRRLELSLGRKRSRYNRFDAGYAYYFIRKLIQPEDKEAGA